MSDFVNRRLQSGEMGVKGALQAAIDESSINSTFDELSDMVIAPGRGGYPEPGRGQGSVRAAAPWLPDPVGRAGGAGQHPDDADDTFTVRATGSDQPRRGGAVARVVRSGGAEGDQLRGSGEQPGNSCPEGQHEERRAGGYGAERREQGVWQKVQYRLLPLAVPGQLHSQITHKYHNYSRFHNIPLLIGFHIF